MSSIVVLGRGESLSKLDKVEFCDKVILVNEFWSYRDSHKGYYEVPLINNFLKTKN